MRISVLDIGTNSILLLVADVDSHGRIAVVRDEQVIARLGKGVDERRRILPETFGRLDKVLGDLRAISDEEGSEHLYACGTSALRDAENRQEFVSFVQDRHGFTIRILSGQEEAALTYRGAILGLPQCAPDRPFAVLDIGGGSTELSLGIGGQMEQRVSLDIGSVRLTERLLKQSPPAHAAIRAARAAVSEALQVWPPLPSRAILVGVAGTLTTLAALELQLPSYNRNLVHGHRLSISTVTSLFDDLSRKSAEAIVLYPQILPGRADVILAGILILEEAMRRVGREEIVVSDRGLRYGILLEAVERLMRKGGNDSDVLPRTTS